MKQQYAAGELTQEAFEDEMDDLLTETQADDIEQAGAETDGDEGGESTRESAFD